MAQPGAVKETAPSIGDYQILTKIGQGGLAEIYKALQVSLQREVAVKILAPQYTHDSDIVRRFEREAIVIARLNHPNIVQIIDRGIQGGRYYFVMEYVDGSDFKTIMPSPDIDFKTKMRMLISICDGLDFAHANGIIHRDIKPANILVDRRGNAKLADFGIAQLRGNTDAETTSSDLVMGTLAYMSPEQKFCSARVTPATDIFALGIILYELCCGRKPEGRFKPPSEVNPQVPRALDIIILKCLEDNPGDRFASAKHLKEALQKVIDGEAPPDFEDSAIFRVESFLGKCSFLDTIHEGPYGAVYLVENKETHKLYVINKKSRDDSGLREARLLASLKHKNILTVLGAGGDQNKTVIVTEYAPGGSLMERTGRKFGWPEAMTIVGQIAAGLLFAHKNHVIHGNLHPSNIFFDREDVVKVTNFGFHRSAGDPKNWFAAPERQITRQGDMYSLGIILFLLLTGKTPPPERAIGVVLNEYETKLPNPILGMLKRLLQTRPGDRYQSLEEFLGEYDAFLKTVDAPRPATTPVSGRKKRKGDYLPILIISGAAVAGILLAIGYLIFSK